LERPLPFRGVLGVLLAPLLRTRPAAQQLLAATLDRADGLAEHDLEIGEFAVDVVVGLGADLRGLLPGLGQDLFGLGLRLAHHLGAGDE
jgi:hypothetical protein